MRIQDEDLRSRKFLHPVSYSRVIRECEARLVEDYIPYLQGECRQMVKDEKTTGEQCSNLRQESQGWLVNFIMVWLNHFRNPVNLCDSAG